MQSMSESEKRARAADIRIMTSKGTLPKCDQCSNLLTMVPFERLSHKYCSLNCVRLHREKSSSESNK